MDNIDLLNYIQQARKSGMGDDQIRQGLIQSGWQVNDVSEAMMNAPIVDSPEPKPKAMMSKSLALIFAVVAFAIVGYAGGAYYMTNFQSFPLWPFEVSVPVPTVEPRPSPTTTPDRTTNPNTYRNEEYGFEITFTNDWENYKIVDEQNENGMGPKIFIACLPSKLDYVFTECGTSYVPIFYIEIFSHSEWAKADEQVISQIEFIMVTSNYIGGIIKVQNVNPELNNQSQNIDQILSTFKFTR